VCYPKDRRSLQSIDQRLPLSFAQQRLWFLSQMDGVSTAYHIPIGLRLIGKLEPEVLRRALDRIVARHEVLRTTFILVDGEPVQRLSTPGARLAPEHRSAARVVRSGCTGSEYPLRSGSRPTSSGPAHSDFRGRACTLA
jgi:hypothetical protein